MYIHNPHNSAEVELENDPTTPKTVWSIHALTYTERRLVERRAGPAPLRALAVHNQVHPTRTDEEIELEKRLTDVEKNAATAKRIEEAEARLQALSVTDRALYDCASDWLAKYDFAVCCFGVDAIDGDEKINVESALDCMRPVKAVRLVIGELSTKISELSRCDEQKKAPSESPPG